MTAWIVNPFDSLPAEGSRPMRYWLMAEALAAAGHDVTYWTADFSHVTKRPRDLAACAAGGSAAAARIKVVAVHEPQYRGNVGVRRLWAHWRLAKNWRRAAEAHPGPRPDVVVVSSPPLALGAEVRRFASGVGAKVIVDVMDAWPETFERVAPRWTLWPLRRLAGANYRGADAVTTVADNYAALVRSYGCRREVRRFYHGIALGPRPAAASAPRKGVRIAYAGSLGRTYDLATAVEAVGLLDGATLEVAGRGEQEAWLKALPADGRVRYAGYLDGAALSRWLASADMGLVPMSPDSCVGVPYKFADYASAGLAVVSSLEGESGRLLARYGAGVSYRAGDPQSLADAIRRAARDLEAMKSASRRLAEAEFDAAAIYGEYADFAKKVAEGGA